MKNKLIISSTVIACAMLALTWASTQAFAARHQNNGQKCYPNSSCRGNENSNGSEYENMEMRSSMRRGDMTTDSIESYRGEVKRVSRVRSSEGTQIEAMIETNRGELHVMLGPASYMDRSDVQIRSGDKVRIRGYQVTSNGKTMIVATSIEKDGNEVQLPRNGGQKYYQGDKNSNGNEYENMEMRSSMKENRNGTPRRALTTDSIESYRGMVKSVSRVRSPGGTQIEAMIETNRGDLHVVLGPASYIDRSKVKIQSGDKVRIRGYQVSANGKTMVVATSIEKNGNELQLRNARRQPLWK